MPLICKSLGKVERDAVEFHMMSRTLAGMFISSTWGIELTWCPAVILFQTGPVFPSVWIRASDITSLWYCESMWPLPTRDLHFVQRLSWNLPSSSPRVWQRGETWLPVTVGEKICSCNYLFRVWFFILFRWFNLSSLFTFASEEAGLISQHIQMSNWYQWNFWMWFQMLRFKLLWCFHIFCIFTPILWGKWSKIDVRLFFKWFWFKFNHQLGRLSDQEILMLMLQKWTKQHQTTTFGCIKTLVKRCNPLPSWWTNISHSKGTFEPMIFPYPPGWDMLISEIPNNHLIQPTFWDDIKTSGKKCHKTTFPSDLPSLKLT